MAQDLRQEEQVSYAVGEMKNNGSFKSRGRENCQHFLKGHSYLRKQGKGQPAGI